MQKLPNWIFTFLAVVVSVVLIMAFIFPGRGICVSNDWCLKIADDAGPSRTSEIPIGTIIASTFEPKIFEDRNPGWKLANGTDVDSETGYALVTNSVKLPDLRGVFLRGMNVGLTGTYADPENDRVAGLRQQAQYPSHDHRFRAVINGHPSSDNGRFSTAYGYIVHDKSPTGRSDRREHINVSSAGAGQDLRPDNVAVYFYIYVGE